MKKDIFNIPAVKAVLLIYVIAISAFICYLTSKVFYETLWPNERVTVVSFMTISILIPYLYMIFSKKDFLRTLVIYHLILISASLVMTMPYEYRLIPLIIIFVSVFTDFETAVVTNTAICGFGFFSMASEPEFFFTIIMLLTGTFTCFIVDKKKSKIYRLSMCGGLVIFSLLLHGIFRLYCKDSYPEYESNSFLLKSQIGIILSLIIFLALEYMYNRFILKKTPTSKLNLMVKDKYKPLELIKKKSSTVYLHSMEVARLSKKAALVIGANDTLAYVGAMYHDVGKIFNTSEYVKEGIKFAKKNSFPDEVINIILTHNVKVNKPNNKEGAIVMLADTAIAAVEYMKIKQGSNIQTKDIISNVVMNRLSTGYLNESTLTVKEIYLIIEAFLEGKE